MIKKSLILISAAICLSFVSAGCEGTVHTPEPDDQQQEEVKLEAIQGNLEIIGNMIFDNNPEFSLQLTNPNDVALKAYVKFTLNSDKGKYLESWADSVEVAASSTKDVKISYTTKLEPGFYKSLCLLNNVTVKQLAFGVKPYDIVSAPDKQPDFDEFWADAKAQLPELIEGETVNLLEIK